MLKIECIPDLGFRSMEGESSAHGRFSINLQVRDRGKDRHNKFTHGIELVSITAVNET